MTPCQVDMRWFLLAVISSRLTRGARMAGEEAVSREVPRGDITTHLLAWSAGNDNAIASVFSALYETLRRLAARALSTERADHTLETTGLVSEAFLRIREQQHVEWRSREHFIATAAQMMRRILIDHARGRGTAKRGQGVAALPLIEAAQMPSESLDELVLIHEALEALEAADPAQSEIVELRFFGGMTHDEIARYLGVSLATVERRWRLGRAWLYRHFREWST
jgi:RNA polymerase sigma-70 factor, ECF subfamily